MKNRSIRIFLLVVFFLHTFSPTTMVSAYPYANRTYQLSSLGWIAFIDKDQRLHVVHADGSGDRVLYQLEPTGKSRDISLQGWSKNGRFLAFYVYHDLNNVIYIWDIQNDTDFIEISDTAPSWGHGILWNPTHEDLFAIGHPITETTQIEIWNVLTQKRVIVHKNGGMNFLWSPDGNILFYDLDRIDSKETGQKAFCPTMPTWVFYDGIYAYDLNANTSKLVIPARENALELDGILPNGKDVVFHEIHLFCTGMDGGCMQGALQQASIDLPQKWTEPLGSECVWSPDGKTAVCGGNFCQKDPLKVIDVNGQIVQPLPQFDVEWRMNSPYQKKWSPNNQKVAIIDSGFLEGTGSINIWDSQSKQVYLSGNHVKYLDWSPDGRYFVTTISPDNSYKTIFVVFDDQTQTEVAKIGEGGAPHNVAWQPVNEGQAIINDKIWQDWIKRKNQSITSLMSPEYKWLAGQSNLGNIPSLPGVDESTAQQLLAQISADPTQLSPENQEAFYRLLLQEETLALVNKQYVNTTEDMGETWANILDLSLSSLKIYAGHETATTMFRSLAQDATDVVINMNTNPQQRDNIHTITDLLFLYAFNGTDLTGYAKDLGPEAWMRWLVARENQRQFKTMVDPLIRQGVNSMFQSKDLYWGVGGTRVQAENNTGYLERQAENFTSFSHENYQNTREALDVVKALNDVADLAVQVTNGKMPWYIAASKAVTTGGIVLLNMWKLHVNIGPALTCNLQMAEQSGMQSFTPVNPNDLPVCKQPEFPGGEYYDPIDRFLRSIDPRTWAQFSEEYSAVLDEYTVLSSQVAQNISSGRPASAAQREAAEQVLNSLESNMAMGSTILTPPIGMTWDAQTFAVKQNMMQLKAQTALFALTMDLTKSDLADPEVQTAASLNLATLTYVIQENQDSLAAVKFSGSPVGIPFIEAITQPITASQGESLEFEIRIKNIGTGQLEAGELTVEIVNSQQQRFTTKIPALESGQEQIVVVKFESIQTLPNLAVLSYTSDDRAITRRFEVGEISQGRHVSGKSRLILVGGLIAFIGGALTILGGFLLLKKQKNTQGKAR